MAAAAHNPEWCRKRSEFGDFECGGSVRAGAGNYRKETLCNYAGVFYLRIERGTRTPWWAAWKARSRSWGTTYRPLSSEAAREWARKHLSVEAYGDIFGGHHGIA